jgi:hypothetical protein
MMENLSRFYVTDIAKTMASEILFGYCLRGYGTALEPHGTLGASYVRKVDTPSREAVWPPGDSVTSSWCKCFIEFAAMDVQPDETSR